LVIVSLSDQTLIAHCGQAPPVERLARTYMRDPEVMDFSPKNKGVETIEQFYCTVDAERKFDLLVALLEATDYQSVLVFARTKHGAEKLAKRLGTEGVKSAAIHGDRSQNQRIQALKGFQDGYYRVLVATDVAARGIHVEGIAHVVNYDLPQAPGDFIHRVGRTGRAGTRGIATTFGGRSERGDVALIERTLAIRLTHRNTETGEVMERRDTGVIFMPSSAPRKGRTVYRSIGRGRGGVRRAV
jgi:ATP-dependent RNA helicase RhlE